MISKRILWFVAMFLLAALLASCRGGGNVNDFKGTRVAVSIVPQERFVKEVGGDLVDVVSMIPPGASPANYQPTPRQMQKLSDAEIYFSIGVAAEQANIISRIHDINGDIELVRLEELVAKTYPILLMEDHDHEDGETHEGDIEEADPHIWLSPKRVMLMVEEIRDSLVEMDEKNRETYEDNASEYISRLENLDLRLKEALADLDRKSFIIYHPSYGYFAEDYGLEMITVEEEGKEATVDRLKSIIDLARKREIRVIFYQEEFDSSQAETIAREINGVAIEVSPLSYDYIDGMEDMLEKLEPVLK